MRCQERKAVLHWGRVGLLIGVAGRVGRAGAGFLSGWVGGLGWLWSGCGECSIYIYVDN